MTSQRRGRISDSVLAVLLAATTCWLMPTVAGAASRVGRGAGSGHLPSVANDVTPPSFAPGTSVAAASSWLQQAIALRLSTLSGLSTQVAAAAALPASDRSTLTTSLTTATTGVQGLGRHAQGDRSLAALSVDAAALVLRFHVLKILVPETDDVLALGGLFTKLAALSANRVGVAAAVAASRQRPVLQAAESALDNELNTEIANAGAALTSVAAALLVLSPSDLPTARALFADFASNRAGVEQDLRAGELDISRIVAKLAQ